MSIGSSTRMDALSRVHKLETTAETTPTRAQAGAPQKPAAGVTATWTNQHRGRGGLGNLMTLTRPAMAPVQNPTTDHFRSRRKSMSNQVMAPVLPAKLVLKTARAALMDPAKHDPPLNPSQPNHRKTVPSTTWLWSVSSHYNHTCEKLLT